MKQEERAERVSVSEEEMFHALFCSQYTIFITVMKGTRGHTSENTNRETRHREKEEWVERAVLVSVKEVFGASSLFTISTTVATKGKRTTEKPA